MPRNLIFTTRLMAGDLAYGKYLGDDGDTSITSVKLTARTGAAVNCSPVLIGVSGDIEPDQITQVDMA